MTQLLHILKLSLLTSAFVGLLSVMAIAQGLSLSGKFIDKADNEPLIGVNVLITSMRDSTIQLGGTSDLNGAFQLSGLPPGAYKLKATYIGYQSIEQDIRLMREDINLGTIGMEQAATELEGVTVEGVQVRAQQQGDTTVYNANAFKVNPDADAEQLIQKMPGVTIENGTVKAQGEDVRRVLVDGQEFFGEDATLALRNLPAEVIDKIQVFDRLNDQSQFTGFDDGNAEKTINIVTRPGMSTGQFGKVFAGYGTDERYAAGLSMNIFNGQQRISLIGLSNNINQQNFSTQDLTGLVGSSGGGRGGRGGGGGGGWRGRGGGNAGDFLVGQRGGINTTNSFGLNYSDVWGKKAKITGSYFFNNAKNNTVNILSQEFFLADSENQFYDENSLSESKNFNHRINVRFEYTIDSSNSLIIRPSVNFQDFSSLSVVSGLTSLGSDALLSKTQNDFNSENNALNFSNDILWQHRFAKRGRTLSTSIRTGFNNSNGNSNLYSLNEFFNRPDPTEEIDQLTDNDSDGFTLSSRITYTEPIGEKSQLQFTYQPSYNASNSIQNTNQLNEINNEYSILDTLLSSNFDNEVVTQRGGIGYRLRGEKTMFMFNADFQNVQLSSSQVFPTDFSVEKSFNNFVPFAMFTYTPNKATNLRLFYRTNTNTPSLTQLQNVVNNTNPLQLRTGNPDLKQQYSQTLLTRFNLTNAAKAQTFFVYVSTTYTNDYIGNSTIIAARDTVLEDGVILNRGSQLTRPVNLDNNWNIRSFMTYGLPVKFLKSNLNLNAGFTYGNSPGLINDNLNESNTYNMNGGLVLGSNISPRFDFTIGYSANYNIVENSLQPQLDNNYFFQTSTLRFNWLPWKGFVLNTDLAHTLYSGLGEGFDQDFLLWNAGIGYKFLKNSRGELRLTAFDLLKQNNSISRTVSETSVQDNITEVLQQYFMLTFTYNLRNFRIGAAPAPRPDAGNFRR